MNFWQGAWSVDLEQDAGRQRYTRKRGHLTTYLWVTSADLQRPVPALLQCIPKWYRQWPRKKQRGCGPQSYERPTETDCGKLVTSIKTKVEKLLQALLQADNRFSDAAWPHTETVRGPIWWTMCDPFQRVTDEPDQFAKMWENRFQASNFVESGSVDIKTFQLGYQPPMKEVCADCELYNLPIGTAPPALKVAMLCCCAPSWSTISTGR